MEELFDELDENGEFTGKIVGREEAHRTGAWHRAVLLYIVNGKGQVLIQKRSQQKKLWPGCWDGTGGGHVDAGDIGMFAAIREVEEELGTKLEPSDIRYIGCYRSNKKHGGMWDCHFNEFYVVHKEVDIKNIKLQESEVDEIKWIDFNKFKGLVQSRSPLITAKWEAHNALIKYMEVKNMDKIKRVRGMVSELLGGDESGHGMDHTERVVCLALQFAEAEGADAEVVTLAALLHDADDYKLVGIENAKGLVNTRRILTEAGVDKGVSGKVLDIIGTMGYSKMLKGIRPKTIEGKIVSDADMCDAVGSNGFVRTRAYGIKQGRPLFNRNIWPVENIGADKYASKASDTCVCHCFEKLLRLKDCTMTKSGQKEIGWRHKTVVDFLQGLFREEGATEWLEYLEKFEKRKLK